MKQRICGRGRKYKVKQTQLTHLDDKIRKLKDKRRELLFHQPVEGLRKITVRVYDEDLVFLKKHKLEYNAIVRDMLAAYVDQAKTRIG